MSNLSDRDTKHIFEKLRAGLVPERALDSYAVGIDKELGEIDRQFDLVQSGEGQTKFLRGDYGCGKTFVARLAIERAQRRGFATSFVVVSPNDLKFHRFDEVYNKVVSNLATVSCERQALGDILDRWIGGIEDKLVALGIDEDSEEFDAQVNKRISEDLATLTNGKVPADFVRVIQTIFELKQEGEVGPANTLISWLAGSGNIDAAAKRRANIKGEVTSKDAMDYLRGVVEIVHAAGYKGLLIVIDEAETILRNRSDSRHKSLNGIRQIVDSAGSYPRLLWLFTGTPDFFDTRKGVAGLAPLNDRIQFQSDGKYASRRQPQLQLRPFDRERLITVSKRLQALYLPLLKEGTDDPEVVRARKERHTRLISDAYIEALVDSVTAGFGGDVGVVPRQFLRKFVNSMDILRDEDDETYDPLEQLRASGYVPKDMSDEEQALLRGEKLMGEGDDLALVEDAW